MDLNPGEVKPRTMKLVFVASPLNMQHLEEKELGIRIMCLESSEMSTH